MPLKNLQFRPLSSPLDGPLAQLLSLHDDARRSGFITHLNKSSLSHKRIMFMKAFVMNFCLLTVIVWLVSATIVRDMYTPLSTPILVALCATQDLIISWAIYSILITTTIPFFFGECRLRLYYGFRPTEVVFRRPPALDQGLSEDERLEQYRRFVARAMDPYLIYSSLWSFMTSELWVLAYPAIMDAHDQIDAGKIDEGRLESAIWRQEGGIWSACEIYESGNMV